MKVIIIGNGISGTTAARYIRKRSNHEITIISSETDFFFSRTALMYIYMGHMTKKNTQPYEDDFWEKNRIKLVNDHIETIDFSKKELRGKGGKNYSYDKLILATGSKPNKFGWPGQDLDGVGGLYSMQDLDYMETHSKDLNRAVIVGGGLIGIEMAEMFHSRHIPVTFLVREDSYWNRVLPPEESKMINQHINDAKIDLRLETELKEIVDDGTGKCKAIVTNKGETIECGFVGLTAGVHPNIAFLKNTPLEIDRGILVNSYLETNIEDVYAIGDCCQQKEPMLGRRPIEAVWYTGRMMGETVAHTITGNKQSYNPGIWFNSAKFINIEYQVYGDIQANPPENHQSIYWELEGENKSIRIVYDKNTEQILGFNLMGIRFRHEVCEKWIRDKTSIHEVMENIELAYFDPEFYRKHTKSLIQSYEQISGKKLKTTASFGLNKVFNFLKK